LIFDFDLYVFFDDKVGENVHYFKFDITIFYFNYNYFRFFYRNHISFLRIIFPIILYLSNLFFYGVNVYIFLYYFSDSSLNFSNFCLTYLFFPNKLWIIFSTFSKCALVFPYTFFIVFLSNTLSPALSPLKYGMNIYWCYYSGFFFVKRELFDITLLLHLSMVIVGLYSTVLFIIFISNFIRYNQKPTNP
jgi:hypothetical protein